MADFHNIARGICTNLAGQVLVCFNKTDLHYFLPGGHIEIGESARTALKREIQEEIGQEVRVGSLVGVLEHAFKKGDEYQHEYNFVFVMALTGTEEVQSKEEYLRFEWHTMDELENLNFLPQKMLALVRMANGTENTNYFASTMEA